MVIIIPVLTQRLIHMVFTVKTMETPQLQFLDMVIDVPVVQVCRFRFVFVVTQRLVPMVLLTVKIRSCSSLTR